MSGSQCYYESESLEGLLTLIFLGHASRICDLVELGIPLELAFLTNTQVLLILLVYREPLS
jgi:hypothetical protein